MATDNTTQSAARDAGQTSQLERYSALVVEAEELRETCEQEGLDRAAEIRHELFRMEQENPGLIEAYANS